MRLVFPLAFMLASGLANIALAEDNTLKPFTTDGCSMWIGGPPNQPNLWRHCCVAHDKAYWIGGLAKDREAADEALRVCVAKAAGVPLGDSMYMAVRGGGGPFWMTPYRWGYGWSYLEHGQPRGYKTATAGEQQQIELLMPAADLLIAEDARQHPPGHLIAMRNAADASSSQAATPPQNNP